MVNGSSEQLNTVFLALADSTRQRVFRAWIEPKALEHWLRPRGMSMTVRSLEAHVGGAFHFNLENGRSIIGTYLHIAPPEKLVFTWSDLATQNMKTVVTLDFLDQGPLTEVVLTHEGLSDPDLRALFGSGWLSLLDALASLLSTPLDLYGKNMSTNWSTFLTLVSSPSCAHTTSPGWRVRTGGGSG